MLPSVCDNETDATFPSNEKQTERERQRELKPERESEREREEEEHFELVGTVTTCLHVARNWLEAEVFGKILWAACVCFRV